MRERRKKNRPMWIDRRGQREASKDFIQKSLLFATLIFALIILNIVDLYFTFQTFSAGGIELNPIMAKLFDLSFSKGATFKVLLVTGASFILWKARYFKLTFYLTLSATSTYTLVLLYQLFLLKAIG